MGRLLSKLPTDVHLGKFLLISTVFRCLDPALTIAATLNSKSPFVVPLGLEQDADRAKSSFRTGEIEPYSHCKKEVRAGFQITLIS
jgi:ATP-dependent RNA helicase DHX29